MEQQQQSNNSTTIQNYVWRAMSGSTQEDAERFFAEEAIGIHARYCQRYLGTIGGSSRTGATRRYRGVTKDAFPKLLQCCTAAAFTKITICKYVPQKYQNDVKSCLTATSASKVRRTFCSCRKADEDEVKTPVRRRLFQDGEEDDAKTTSKQPRKAIIDGIWERKVIIMQHKLRQFEVLHCFYSPILITTFDVLFLDGGCKRWRSEAKWLYSVTENKCNNGWDFCLLINLLNSQVRKKNNATKRLISHVWIFLISQTIFAVKGGENHVSLDAKRG